MNITIYTTPNCVQCNQTKKVFDRAEVSYETVDLSTDEESMAKVKSLGYTAAPVIFAGDKHWSGFKLDRIKDVIDKIKTETH